MRTKIIFIALALGTVAGCRTEHLGGSSYGQRNREAFRAQAEGKKSDPPAPQSAEDAERVMATHRAKSSKGSSAIIAQPGVTSSAGGAPSDMGAIGDAAPGGGYNTSPMRIDAK